MKRTGVIGTGIMGGGMAAHLVRNGWSVVVWNRDRTKAERTGAVVASSIKELAAHCDTVIIALRDDATLRDAVTGPGAALAAARPGTVFLNVTTVTPGCAKEVCAAVEAKGCAFLDAPMTGSKAAASSGQLGLLISGRAEVIDSQRDLLNALAANITDFGDVGNSAAYKLANNQMAATLIRAIGESLQLCQAAGLDRATAVDALVATASRVCGLKRDKLLDREWSADFTTDLMLKDLTQTLDTAAGLGVKMPLLKTTCEIYRAAHAAGAGQFDFASVADFDVHPETMSPAS